MKECWSHNGYDTKGHMAAVVDTVDHSCGVIIVDVSRLQHEGLGQGGSIPAAGD